MVDKRIGHEGMYKNFVKRLLDASFSFLAIVVLSPVLVLLSLVGCFAMKGNPFFTQERPGRNEKIFKLVKFRTMTCERDKDGNLLPDHMRLNAYGKFLRSTSLDELPELFNILKGDMSIVGPRPLLVEYLPYYTEQERIRHSVRPGLSGLAQINGRNAVKWEKRFEYDLEYVKNLSLLMDLKIILKTIQQVLAGEGISVDSSRTEGNLAKIRRNEIKGHLK